jgi:hypothetical protein
MRCSPLSFLDVDNQQKPAFRLALVTVLQCVEGFSERQAAHAIRTRIDWKEALR